MSELWKHAPGERPGNRRSFARRAIISVLVGSMSIGLAWAGSSLVPGDLLHKQSGRAAPAGLDVEVGAGASLATLDLSQGQVLAGAAKVSLEPRPDDYGGVWETDRAACATLDPSQEAFEGTVTHFGDLRVRWAENPDCIYMGGYGIGPMNPITSWDDEYGLWVRSVALNDGSDTIVLTLIDAVYWEAHYNSLCDGCGFIDLADQLSQQLGMPAESFMFASTHSHTSPDFIGGWGAVPEWYMQQATDALKASVTQAVASMRPAVLEAGEEIARQFSSERRDFYRSAEDDAVSWLRLIDASDTQSDPCATSTQATARTSSEPTPQPSPSDRPGNGNGNGNGNGGGNNGNGNGNGGPKPSPTPSPTASPSPEPSPTPEPSISPSPTQSPSPAPSPTCEPPAPGDAIATIGAYAAHPVTADESTGRADADFPGVFAQRVEERFGGIGMFLQTGLGNISPRGDKVDMGKGLANVIPGIGKGIQVEAPDIRVGRSFWDQPVTNVPLGSLGATGFFDRKFNQTPAAVNEGKGEENKKCKSASAVSVRTSVSAAKIGPVWITGGPGELFSNLTNAIEERNPNGITFALGLVNDGLGYIVQSFETDHVGRQGVGFVGREGGVGFAEYEDAYSIDHCFGDATLEQTIRLLDTL